MLFIYTKYDFLLAEKDVTTTLKKESAARTFTLQIITPAVKFLGLQMGGGLVKISRLWDADGKLIHARHYSAELKADIKAFKKAYPIPYLKLWKGYLYLAGILLFAAFIFNLNNKRVVAKIEQETAVMLDHLRHIKQGQLYGASFFTDVEASSLGRLADGWIRINKIEGDTLFVQRSKTLAASYPVFDMDNIADIKPQSEADWEAKEEKINYRLLLSTLETPDLKGVDVLYIGMDHDKYGGVAFTLKGVEQSF